MSLEKRNIVFILIRSPQHCTRTYLNTLKETSFGIRQKASFTLEATVIMPLAAGFLASILFFFRVIQVQTYVDEAVVYAGRLAAVESSVETSEEALLLSAEAGLLLALSGNDVIQEYVEGGLLGISLWESEIKGAEIYLRANYRVKLPIAFFGTKYINLCSQNCFFKWRGDQSYKEETWVYVTPTGSVYHATCDCRVLNLSIKEIWGTEISNVRGLDGQKYYPCSDCGTKEGCAVLVYYTDYGHLYHQNIFCSALKRTIQKVDVTTIPEREACSFCY